jgi:hypothetical protein
MHALPPERSVQEAPPTRPVISPIHDLRRSAYLTLTSSPPSDFYVRVQSVKYRVSGALPDDCSASRQRRPSTSIFAQ